MCTEKLAPGMEDLGVSLEIARKARLDRDLASISRADHPRDKSPADWYTDWP